LGARLETRPVLTHRATASTTAAHNLAGFEEAETMRDNSPYIEPTADCERPPRRDLDEPCDGCGHIGDGHSIENPGNWVICAECRRKYDQ